MINILYKYIGGLYVMRCIATWHNQKKTMVQRHTCRSSMSWCHSLLASVTACNVAFASHLGMFLIYIYIYIYVRHYMSICKYIYIEREGGDRKRERGVYIT